MADRVSPKGYSLAQIVLHWTIAVLVVVQLLVNEDIQEAYKDRDDREPFEIETGA